MRTKALLGLIALGASSIAAMAQSNVYSLNVVGYVNRTVPAGGTVLVANQLNSGTNGINQVLTTAPYGSQVLTFKNGDYNIDVFDGTQWLDNNSGNPSTTVLAPGTGFFFQNLDSNPTTVTFVGEVPQGALTVSYPPGFKLTGTMTPQALELSAANSFPQVYGMQLLTFNGDYTIYVNDGTQWLDNNSGNPVTLTPAVADGYFIQNLDATTYNWTRNFTVQ